jgi:hypothetical protein
MMQSTGKEPEEVPMACEITTGTILVEGNALLPKELKFESEPCLPGWRVVKDFDVYGLDRELLKTGWTFFCSAAEVRATVFGINMQKMLRRAIAQILSRVKSEKLNSLAITRVASVGSERFPLVRYITVSAKLRRIQQTLFLYRAKDIPRLETRGSEILSDSTGIANEKTQLSQQPGL